MGTICGANRLRSARQRLRKVLRRTNAGIQYVEYAKGDGAEMFEAVCKLGLEGFVSKRLEAM
jgi:ATP-dependent DNA ligase